jgi:hypothetical protein
VKNYVQSPVVKASSSTSQQDESSGQPINCAEVCAEYAGVVVGDRLKKRLLGLISRHHSPLKSRPLTGAKMERIEGVSWNSLRLQVPQTGEGRHCGPHYVQAPATVCGSALAHVAPRQVVSRRTTAEATGDIFGPHIGTSFSTAQLDSATVWGATQQRRGVRVWGDKCAQVPGLDSSEVSKQARVAQMKGEMLMLGARDCHRLPATIAPLSESKAVSFYTFSLCACPCLYLLLRNVGKCTYEAEIRKELQALHISVKALLELQSKRQVQGPIRTAPWYCTLYCWWREALMLLKCVLSATSAACEERRRLQCSEGACTVRKLCICNVTVAILLDVCLAEPRKNLGNVSVQSSSSRAKSAYC